VSQTEDEIRLALPDEAATLALGHSIARVIEPGLRIFLSGELGAGKTTLVRGVLRGLGYQERVKSPTYTLVELYVVSTLHLYHFDFYRFSSPEEWESAGFRDLFDSSNICLVEWPERALSLLPKADLLIHLQHLTTEGREATLQSATPRGAALIAKLRPATS
jgi:tRNA threonylcarbamoyladenosine biosynthesis protein TsaE